MLDLFNSKSIFVTKHQVRLFSNIIINDPRNKSGLSQIKLIPLAVACVPSKQLLHNVNRGAT